MIRSFRHKGLRKFFETGSPAGVQANHARRLRIQLAALDTAQMIDDMDPWVRTSSTQGLDARPLVDLYQW